VAYLFKNRDLSATEFCATLRQVSAAESLDLSKVEAHFSGAGPTPVCPFILYEDHTFPRLANAFIQSRSGGNIFDTRPLAPSSLWDYARDLVFFLSLYSDPEEHELTDSVFSHYLQHLESLRYGLSPSTIERRAYVARLFRQFVVDSGTVATPTFKTRQGRVRTLINLANTRVSISDQRLGTTGRRRPPTLLHVLPPEELRRFFAAFQDRTLRGAAMTIYSTGARRIDVCQLTAGATVSLRPAYSGGPSFLPVISKGRKQRQLEIEHDLAKGFKSFGVSPHRLKRAKLYSSRHSGGPFDNHVPLFINRYGDPLSPDAITDAFRRASLKCGIKRTPHELRHEFAVNYLLNSYRGIERSISRKGFDSWLGQLIDSNQNIVVVRLARLLGHSDPEFTKKNYLVMLAEADPMIRDAWCEHLSSVNLSAL